MLPLGVFSPLKVLKSKSVKAVLLPSGLPHGGVVAEVCVDLEVAVSDDELWVGEGDAVHHGNGEALVDALVQLRDDSCLTGGREEKEEGGDTREGHEKSE